MKALRTHAVGGPETLTLDEIAVLAMDRLAVTV
jgi:hypothetical protein